MYVRVESSRHYRKRIRSASLGKWWGWIPWFLSVFTPGCGNREQSLFRNRDRIRFEWPLLVLSLRCEGCERNKSKIEKNEGDPAFLDYTVKKACDTDYPPNTPAKGKYPYFSPVCVFRFFLLSVSDPTHVFPRGMDQEPLPANPDGRRLVV